MTDECLSPVIFHWLCCEFGAGPLDSEPYRLPGHCSHLCGHFAVCHCPTSVYCLLCLCLWQGWLDIHIADIYHWYISDINPIFSSENIRYFRLKISDIFDILSIFLNFLMWHIVWLCFDFQSVCFAGLWLVPSAFSQCWTTSVRLQPIHSNEV